jgi:hypothetical protein
MCKSTMMLYWICFSLINTQMTPQSPHWNKVQMKQRLWYDFECQFFSRHSKDVKKDKIKTKLEKQTFRNSLAKTCANNRCFFSSELFYWMNVITFVWTKIMSICHCFNPFTTIRLSEIWYQITTYALQTHSFTVVENMTWNVCVFCLVFIFLSRDSNLPISCDIAISTMPKISATHKIKNENKINNSAELIHF